MYDFDIIWYIQSLGAINTWTVYVSDFTEKDYMDGDLCS